MRTPVPIWALGAGAVLGGALVAVGKGWSWAVLAGAGVGAGAAWGLYALGQTELWNELEAQVRDEDEAGAAAAPPATPDDDDGDEGDPDEQEAI